MMGMSGTKLTTTGTLRLGGRKFRIVSEEEYRAMRAAMKFQQDQARLDALDVAEAKRRLRDPKRKSMPLSSLKAELGL